MINTVISSFWVSNQGGSLRSLLVAVQCAVLMAMNFLSTHNLQVGEMIITLLLVTLQPLSVPFQEIFFPFTKLF